MPHVTLAKELILQHRAERRRERHGKLKRHMIIDQALHHAHQRDITFRYCFEEPVFFQKMLVVGMANERQMRVKSERERTGYGKTSSVSFRVMRGTYHKISWHSSEDGRGIRGRRCREVSVIS